jgi:hypothetical protein
MSSVTYSGSCSVQLCEALGAIGGLQSGALLSLLPDILEKLRELKCVQEPTTEQVHTKVYLNNCVVIYVSHCMALRSFNPLKHSGNYMHHLLEKSLTLAFCVYEFHVVLNVTRIISLNSKKHLILVVEKCCLFFEIWTEFFKILFG